MKRFILLVSIGLAACSQEDATFGRSYDACVLKHGASDTAKEICERHFTRAPTQAEKEAIRQAGSVELKLNEEGSFMTDNKPWDKIVAIVPDPKDDNLVVTKVRVTATFYRDPAKMKPLPGMPVVWAGLDYDDSTDAVGLFQGDKAPSPYMKAYVEPTKVYSHNGK